MKTVEGRVDDEYLWVPLSWDAEGARNLTTGRSCTAHTSMTNTGRQVAEYKSNSHDTENKIKPIGLIKSKNSRECSIQSTHGKIDVFLSDHQRW